MILAAVLLGVALVVVFVVRGRLAARSSKSSGPAGDLFRLPAPGRLTVRKGERL